MLTYAVAQLNPPAGPLAQAIPLEHQLHSATDDGDRHLFKIGLTWIFEPDPRNYFGLGQTGGFSSFIFFNTEHQLAGVVLFNRFVGAENLGYRIEGLMEGERAYPLVAFVP
jgi:serine-type D-Ala-D-Ala carboxypeptidase/endopeptidase